MILVAAAAIGLSAAGEAQTAADSAGVRQAALDYIEGWYAGDAARMERALHPELAKRIVGVNPETGDTGMRDMTAEQLVQATAAGYGTRTPRDQVRTDVTILDIYEGTASARVDASDWIDYMHLALWNGEWKIVNVLWQVRPEARQ
jgi:hypothetical protein